MVDGAGVGALLVCPLAPEVSPEACAPEVRCDWDGLQALGEPCASHSQTASLQGYRWLLIGHRQLPSSSRL